MANDPHFSRMLWGIAPPTLGTLSLKVPGMGAYDMGCLYPVGTVYTHEASGSRRVSEAVPV